MENYPNCNNIVLVDKPISGNDISSFVTICRKENLGYREPQELCNLGKIFVRYDKYGNAELENNQYPAQEATPGTLFNFTREDCDGLE